MKTMEEWEQWVDAHTTNGDPEHDLAIICSRMQTVLDMNGAPDRAEVWRWITAIDRVAATIYSKEQDSTRRFWKRKR